MGEEFIRTAPESALLVDPALAPTPPMGFNTWNAFRGRIGEEVILDNAEALVRSGLADLGYRYVNLDDGWMAGERTGNGDLQPDPAKFPRGIKPVIDELHGMGLQAGIYTDAGVRTCLGMPGSYGYEERDAELFASWEVDFLKHDWCYVPLEEFPGSPERGVAERLYTKMAAALVATGRPIVFSMCNWGGKREPWLWARGIAHLWRTTPDITDRWRFSTEDPEGDLGVLEIAEINVALSDFGGPGGWNDPDMLEVGNPGLTVIECRSHLSLWAMMAAPLFIGCDLPAEPDSIPSVLGNREVIAIDQDPLGRQGRLAKRGPEGWVMVKELADGGRAILAFNPADQPEVVAADAAELGLNAAGSWSWREVWDATTARGSSFEVELQPHDAKLWRVTPIDHASE
jgi:alpha-galactosidase